MYCASNKPIITEYIIGNKYTMYHSGKGIEIELECIAIKENGDIVFNATHTHCGLNGSVEILEKWQIENEHSYIR